MYITTHTCTRNNQTIDILKLIKLMKGRSVEYLSLASISGISKAKSTGFSQKRFDACCTTIPCIVDSNNILIDGRHRVLKLLSQQVKFAYFYRATDKDLQKCLMIYKHF